MRNSKQNHLAVVATVMAMMADLPRLSPREVGRPKFRHANGLVGGNLYVYDQPTYDVYIVAPNTVVTKQTLFAIPIGSAFTPPGGAALVKNEWHTNMTQNAVLAAPAKQVVRGISADFRGDVTPHDINLMLGQSLFIFKINSIPYLQTWLQDIPGAGGAYSGAAAGIVTNSVPRGDGMRLLDESGETLEQQQQFSVTIDPTLFNDGTGSGAFTSDATTTTPPGTGIVIKVALEGQYARAVQ